MSKSYIIKLKDGVDSTEVKESIYDLGGEVNHDFPLINGFSVTIPEPDGLHIESIKSKHTDAIELIEEDQEVHHMGA
ncbi:Pbi2p Ecym_3348 [Eremothecium cymbalariae DBVPG|uniref:Inhibitor I9 domain-containing protein n=1 Tax=Eremothecium cymbalariae (strain CBS 270.75 / DBVPG 7215 / KCTC 17166 / NRRL Y-17582) TaxID=931890 RepID=G8JRR7_ERECY|nr:Hypothetical protein Ecym_3348 [Eremothecium cymbalariae DBVPG\